MSIVSDPTITVRIPRCQLEMWQALSHNAKQAGQDGDWASVYGLIVQLDGHLRDALATTSSITVPLAASEPIGSGAALGSPEPSGRRAVDHRPDMAGAEAGATCSVCGQPVGTTCVGCAEHYCGQHDPHEDPYDPDREPYETRAARTIASWSPYGYTASEWQAIVRSLRAVADSNGVAITEGNGPDIDIEGAVGTYLDALDPMAPRLTPSQVVLLLTPKMKEACVRFREEAS